MNHRSRRIYALLALPIAFLTFRSAHADYTALNYNPSTHWISGGSLTYVGLYDEPGYCTGYDNVNMMLTFPYDWWMRDVYDGSNDGYMDVCTQMEYTKYGSKVEGVITGPGGAYFYTGPDTQMELPAQVFYGFGANLNGTYTATASHWLVTQYTTCDIEYHYQDWPQPHPINCFFNSSFETWQTNSSDDVEVTGL